MDSEGEGETFWNLIANPDVKLTPLGDEPTYKNIYDDLGRGSPDEAVFRPFLAAFEHSTTKVERDSYNIQEQLNELESMVLELTGASESATTIKKNKEAFLSVTVNLVAAAIVAKAGISSAYSDEIKERIARELKENISDYTDDTLSARMREFEVGRTREASFIWRFEFSDSVSVSTFDLSEEIPGYYEFTASGELSHSIQYSDDLFPTKQNESFNVVDNDISASISTNS
jgi:hypothetical protein